MIIIIIITDILQYDHHFCKSVLQMLFYKSVNEFHDSLFTPPNLLVLPITWMLYEIIPAFCIIGMIYNIEFTLCFSSFFIVFLQYFYLRVI
jgi:hypothetical protein